MRLPSKYEMIRRMLSDFKQPKYRYAQIMDAIFKQNVGEYGRMTILPKFLRDELIRMLGPNVCSIVPVKELTSKQVSKVLFAIEGDERVEAVRLTYEQGWRSYCISTQCGCGFGCRFCATGTIGLKRNLTADEITDQLLHFRLNGHALDSVSFMGMGEALANPHIFDAITILTDPHLFGLGHRRITISTIGLLPGIDKADTGVSASQSNLLAAFAVRRSAKRADADQRPIPSPRRAEGIGSSHPAYREKGVYCVYSSSRSQRLDGTCGSSCRVVKGKGTWGTSLPR